MTRRGTYAGRMIIRRTLRENHPAFHLAGYTRMKECRPMTDQLDGVFVLELILTGALIGVIPGMIAQRKGYTNTSKTPSSLPPQARGRLVVAALLASREAARARFSSTWQGWWVSRAIG
jgi:hypothetical protein